MRNKTNIFDIYINKIVKQISSYNSGTELYKRQLNSIIHIILDEILNKCIFILKINNKKILNQITIENCLKLLLSGQLLYNTIEEGKKTIEKYNLCNENMKGYSKQTKANIIFSPSLLLKIIKSYNISVSPNVSIFLAGVIEYICSELIDLSCTILRNKDNHKRITVKDLFLGISNDIEINEFINKLNIKILGSGVKPYINPFLLKKNKVKRKNKEQNNNTQNKHRYKPGTVALREIKSQQEDSCSLVMCNKPFQKIIREILKNNNSNLKISKKVFTVLQYYIEQYIINILKDANSASIHAKRTKLISDDIYFICKLYNINIIEYSDIILTDEKIEENFNIKIYYTPTLNPICQLSDEYLESI